MSEPKTDSAGIALIREERRKLLSFLAVVIGLDLVLFAVLPATNVTSDTYSLLALLSLAMKIYFAVRVYRFAWALGHGIGLRVLYVILSIFSVVLWIPVVALLVAAHRRLKQLPMPSISEGVTAAQP